MYKVVYKLIETVLRSRNISRFWFLKVYYTVANMIIAIVPCSLKYAFLMAIFYTFLQKQRKNKTTKRDINPAWETGR